MLNKKIVGCSMINLMIAYYLTSIISQITLTTKLQAVLVFMYFMLILTAGTIFCIKRKFDSKFDRKFLGIAIIMAILFTANFYSRCLPEKYEENEVILTAQNEKNQKSQGMEIWLNSVLVNGKEQNLYEIVNSVGQNSSWNITNGLLMLNADKREQKIMLKLPKAESIEMHFGRHEWSGIVEIRNGKYIEQYDLYDKSGNELIVKIPVVKGEYSSMMNIIFLIGIMGIAFYCCIILIYYLTSKMKWLSDWTIR